MRDIKIKKRRTLPWADKPHRRTLLCVAVLLLVAIITHRQWFNPFSILTFGDWQYRPDENIRQMFSSWQSWVPFEGFGTVNILMSGFPFRGLAWAAIGNTGMSYDMATKITLLVPIAFGGFLTAFLLAYRLFKDRAIAFIVALTYGATPYYLSIQAGHFPIDIVYMLVPLLVYWLDVAMERNALRYWIAFTTTFSVGIFYEVRLMYIASFALAAYFVGYIILHKKDWKQYIRPLAVVGGLTILINMFWLLPTKLAAGASIGEVAQRGLFGNSLFNIMQSFTMMKWNWTGGEVNRYFVAQPVPAYLWLVPIIAFSGFLVMKKKWGPALVFGFITLLGIFLTKQSAPPFTQAYGWLYNNFPGFILFREASKFYVLVAFGMFGLLGYTLLAIRERRHDSLALHLRSARWWKYAYCTAFAVLALVAIVNLKPAFNEQLAGTFRNTPMPQDYQLFKNYVKGQPDFFRTYWLPRESWWGYYDNQHPRVRAVDTLEQAWAPFTDGKGGNSYELARKSLNIFNKSFSPALFADASIKYVVVPPQDAATGDDFFSSFGNDRQYFINALDQVPFLKRVNIGTKQLAIYENTNYKPYIGTATTVHAVTNTKNPTEQTSFIAAFLGSNFTTSDQLAKDDQAQKLGIGKVDTLFDFTNPEQTLLQQDTLEQKTTASKGSYIQVGQKAQNLSYELTPAKKGLQLNIYKNAAGSLWVNGSIADRGDTGSLLRSVALPSTDRKDYYLSTGDKVVALDTTPGRHNIGNTTEDITIARANPTNLITNPSFENGPWQTKVQDCNNYDHKAKVSMEVGPHSDSQDPTDKKALALYAQNHTACTTQSNIPVSGGKPYMLRFNYRNEGGQQLSYQLTYNDPKHTVVDNRVDTAGKSWHALNRSFTVPQGATKVSLTLKSYPSTDQGISSTTYYDDFVLNGLDTTFASQAVKPTNQKIPVPAGPLKLSYQDASLDLRNHISNPSFENGAWQKTVDDCHNFDKKPGISMKVDSSIASDGKQALRLDAANHIACTHQANIPVQGNTPYFFTFDYNASNTDQVRYRILFNDPGQTTIDRTVPVSGSSVWHHLATSVQVPPGATNMTLSVFATPNSYGKKHVTVRYDNFRLVQVPAIAQAYHLVTSSNPALKDPASISYNSTRPTKKLITVHGATTPFYLTMNETYDKHWQLDQGPPDTSLAAHLPFSHPATVAGSNHFAINGPLNAWYVDPAAVCGDAAAAPGCVKNDDGSYDLQFTAEFTPQRWFNFGLIISAVSFGGCVGYLGYAWVRQHKKRKLAHVISRRAL